MKKIHHLHRIVITLKATKTISDIYGVYQKSKILSGTHIFYLNLLWQFTEENVQ